MIEDREILLEDDARPGLAEPRAACRQPARHAGWIEDDPLPVPCALAIDAGSAYPVGRGPTACTEYERRRPEMEEAPWLGGFGGGPSRARTGDLIPARDALSQLSYGPAEPLKCSPELVVPRPLDSQRLIVQRRCNAKVNLSKFHELFGRKEITAVQLRAVQGEGVELTDVVPPVDEAISVAPARVQTTDHDVALPDHPLALHPKQPRPKIEDQIESLVIQRPPNSKSVLERDCRNLRLGDCALLVRRQHRPRR